MDLDLKNQVYVWLVSMSEYNLMQMDKKNLNILDLDMLLYYIGSMLALSRGMRSNECHSSHQTSYSKTWQTLQPVT